MIWNPHIIFESTSQSSFTFCINLQCYQTQLVCTFLAQTLHTLVKKSTLKCNFLSAPAQNLFWKRQVHSSPNFHHSSLSRKIIPVYFSSSTNIYFAQKEPIKVKMFETFQCSGQNLSISLCQFCNNKSIFLQILYLSWVSWKKTPLYIFSSDSVYFAQKELLNLSNSLCQFWNDESIPLQMLHHSSVSKEITPLYYFSLNNLCFAQKEPIKVKHFETFECLRQNLSNSSCQFWNVKSIPLQILHHFLLLWYITPL